MDSAFRQLLSAELISMIYNEGGSLVVPQGMRFQPLPPAQFAKYKEALSGLTADNAHQVTQKLVELGLQPGAGIGLPGDVQMRDSDDPELKRVQEAAVGALGDVKGGLYADMVAQLQQGELLGEAIDRPPLPMWAAHMEDLRGELRFDSTQYVVPIAIGGKVTLAIVDTGAHRTVMDTKMAAVLGLQVRRAPSNYGRFSVPGSDAVHAYVGVLAGETVLQLSGRVLARVNNLRVIEHPRPFFLLGADILRGGRPTDQWNFTGLKVVTMKVNEVRASLGFDVRG